MLWDWRRTRGASRGAAKKERQILRQQWNCVCKFHVVTRGSGSRSSNIAEIIKVECTRNKKREEKNRDAASLELEFPFWVAIAVVLSFRGPGSRVLGPGPPVCLLPAWQLFFHRLLGPSSICKIEAAASAPCFLHCKCAAATTRHWLQLVKKCRNNCGSSKRFCFALA